MKKNAETKPYRLVVTFNEEMSQFFDHIREDLSANQFIRDLIQTSLPFQTFIKEKRKAS